MNYWKKKAIVKIQNFQKLKLVNFNRKTSSSFFSSINSGSSINSSSFSHSENSNPDYKSLSKDNDDNEEKSINSKDNINNKNESINENNDFNKKDENFGENSRKKGILFNLYYKVNLSKIKYLIYDFHKEAIIEDKNENNHISKIENILNNYKNEFSINIEKDETYPFISLLKCQKEEIKNNNINDEQKNNKHKKDIKKIINNNQNNSDKLLITKITEAINNHKDEIPIKKLKYLTIISFIILIFIGFGNLKYDLNFYSSIKELHLLIRNSLYIKNNNLISIYYIRELTLLNFNLQDKNGIEYLNIPEKSKHSYISIIKSKLVELSKENQISIKKLFSSTLNLSKNTSKYFSESLININFLTIIHLFIIHLIFIIF